MILKILKNKKKENKKDDRMVVFFVEKKHRKVPQATQKQGANRYRFYARAILLPVAVPWRQKSAGKRFI